MRSLVPTQESMQTVALYIRINNGDYRKIIEVYEHEIARSSVFHKLNLFYLANEILQCGGGVGGRTSSADALTSGVRSIVSLHFASAKREASEFNFLYQKFCDLEKVWIDRRIFSPDELSNFYEVVVTTGFEDELANSEVCDGSAVVDVRPVENDAHEKEGFGTAKRLENRYAKERVIEKINELYDSSGDLIEYLKGFIFYIENRGHKTYA